VNGVATDGRVVLSASGDKTLRLWEIHRGTMIRMLTGHADPVTACALSQRAHRVGGKTVRLVASGDSRQLIRLWDADSGQAVANLKGHGRGITGCAFSPVDELLASTSLDGTAAFWSLENGGIVKAIDCATEAGASYPTTCAFSPDGRLLLIGQSDGRLWAYHRGEDSQVTIRPSSNDSQGIVACGFSSDGRLVFAAARSGEVRIWDVSDLAQPKAIAVHFARHALTASALAPDNAALGLGDTRGAVMLLRLESGARRKIRLL
jgi:WD40 repeat protein